MAIESRGWRLRPTSQVSDVLRSLTEQPNERISRVLALSRGIALAGVLVLLAGGSALAIRRSSSVAIEDHIPLASGAASVTRRLPSNTTVASAGAAVDAEASSVIPTSAPPTTVPSHLFVHVAGAVRHPGLVKVAAGARVDDVVSAAGGPTGAAELDGVNLAALVSDGERIYVPIRGRPPVTVSGPAVVAGGVSTDSAGSAGGASSSTAAITIIDLNTATVEQLDVLPGVGPATASAIVEYRTGKGRFRSVTELLEVPGIGEAKLARIRSRVKV